jgi:hypothetical protein
MSALSSVIGSILRREGLFHAKAAKKRRKGAKTRKTLIRTFSRKREKGCGGVTDLNPLPLAGVPGQHRGAMFT